jgi:Zn-finger nucleic acid-binding protein
MNCNRYQKKLSRIFDRKQTPDRRLQQHIDACPDCRRFWEDLHSLDMVLSDMTSPGAPGDLTVRVNAAIRRTKEKRSFVLRPAWAGGFAVVAAFIVGIWIGNTQEPINGAEYQTSELTEMFTEYNPGSLWEFELTDNNSH